MSEWKRDGASEAAHPVGRARAGVDRPAFDSGPAALGLRECPPPACSWKGGWDTAGDVGNVPTTQQHLVIASCGDSCGLNFLKTSFCFSKGLQI